MLYLERSWGLSKQAIAMMRYYVRTATAADMAELNRLHTENMQAYVERVYPWNATLFKDNFVASEYQIIESNHNILGFFKLVVSQDIYLAEIQIAGSYQNRGIGSKIIKELIEKARVSNRRIWLKVVRGNPALKLYQRLGFVVFETSSTHLKLELTTNS